ncbi:MAG: metal-dependent transcriptional regulator [Candidatus Bathyarchaeota archaeon]|nr:metal-dependent transcriptional regulator [Candidatus Bathyarchaeota archaeon]
MEPKHITVSSEAEEYLEAIYRLEKKTGSAKTMELARQLKVVPGSITNTIEGLERRGLVLHEPYKGVKLTEKGRKIALDVLRRHRLAERLLTDILHLDWSEAHDTACKLEHAITPNIIKPLEKTLGHPKTCPHGSPIPTACGGIIEEESVPLAKLSTEQSGIIVKIVEEKVEVLQHLAALGLAPGVHVEVEKKTFFDGPVSIRVGEVSHTLDYGVASIINVSRTDGKTRGQK